MALTFNEVKEIAADINLMGEYRHKSKFKKSFDEMAVHTRKSKPDDILLARRPNEDQEVLNYRLNNYESITYGSINKAFDNINRPLNALGYKLHVNDQDVNAYLDTKSFMRTTFKSFYSDIYLKRMIEDPNGFLAWIPAGAGVKTKTEKVKPKPVLLFSFDLVDVDDVDGEYMIFIAPEKTKVKRDDVIVKDGSVYYIFTKNAFYRYSEKDSGDYVLTEEYVHNIGEIPVIMLGGDYNSDGHFESYFEPFLAFGNESIRQFSDFQALSAMAAHPIREEFVMECEVQEIEKKKSTTKANSRKNENYKAKTVVKPVAVRGPFNTRQRAFGDGEDRDGLGTSYLPAEVPSIRFINPDIEFVKNAWATTKEMLELAEDALHLNLGEQNQSGVAKELDLLSHEDMLAKIGTRVLESMQTSARYITAYMSVISYDKTEVKLTLPATFRIKTGAELMSELTNLKAANAPAMLVGAVARELAAIRFQGDEVNQKIFTVISMYDPLFIYSISEKQGMIISNISNKDDVTKSAYIYTILFNLSMEMGQAFIEASDEEIYKKFSERVKPYLISSVSLVDNNGETPEEKAARLKAEQEAKDKEDQEDPDKEEEEDPEV